MICRLCAHYRDGSVKATGDLVGLTLRNAIVFRAGS